MPRFKSSQDILKIVSNKDQIRNMGIIAHVDHGKCVSGDSLVTLANGKTEEIVKIHESLKAEGPAPLRVRSLNPQTLRIEDKHVSHVWKLHSDRLVNVTLQTGSCVETTPEHPFYTLAKNGGVAKKRADEISRGDLVLAPDRVLNRDVHAVRVKEVESYTGGFDVYDLTVPENHTFIANGMVVHNTTMTDSLLAGAGLLSPGLAGTALAMDFMEEEQKRQMTIKAANVSLLHEEGGTSYVINLIDTPGHVDFSGKVTRSLRAIDGAGMVGDSVEEVMVQTETVTRQALEERVRPVLYINKIDRLIKELKLNNEQIQERIGRIIKDFNALLDLYAEPEFREKWKVSFASNTVAMGSAKDRWGFNFAVSRKHGVKFSDVVDAYSTGKVDDLKTRMPIHEAILGMAVGVMAPPHVAQRYRIPKIWHGDPNSDVGQDMINCNDKGPVLLSVTNIVVDPQAGAVATGRLFSGTVEEGEAINLINSNATGRIQQVAIYMGPNREIVGRLSAGNIPALLGLENVKAGETISSVKPFVPFEAVHYVTEPVVTIAVEPKLSRDLPKLV